MRTTINLPDDLAAQVKRVAVQSRTSVTALIADALRELLGRRRRKVVSSRVQLTTFGKGGLLPGVDLDDSASLLDLMDSSHALDRR